MAQAEEKKQKKKKGLSADEKQKKMLELFYESKEFFQMKELEKIAPKQKGVISQSVKDVTQILVDEGLVECEKIGTFVCYWAFPSKAVNVRKRRIADLETKIAEMEAKIKEEEELLEEAKKDIQDEGERDRLKAELTAAREEEETLAKRLKTMEAYDPEVIARIEEEASKAKASSNLWIENVFMLKKWCKSKFGTSEKEFDKQFGIPEDFDYVE